VTLLLSVLISMKNKMMKTMTMIITRRITSIVKVKRISRSLTIKKKGKKSFYTKEEACSYEESSCDGVSDSESELDHEDVGDE
ncbi:hypothetical protein KI387_038814, partial [Taxus chinensis]